MLQFWIIWLTTHDRSGNFWFRGKGLFSFCIIQSTSSGGQKRYIVYGSGISGEVIGSTDNRLPTHAHSIPLTPTALLRSYQLIKQAGCLLLRSYVSLYHYKRLDMAQTRPAKPTYNLQQPIIAWLLSNSFRDQSIWERQQRSVFAHLRAIRATGEDRHRSTVRSCFPMRGRGFALFC